MAKKQQPAEAPKARPRRREIFVRLEVAFVLNDLRYTQLGDLAARLYLWLAATAVNGRREILPPEYTAKAIAAQLNRTEGAVKGAFRELCCGRRPLVEVMADARLRVVGIRKLTGERFKWRPEPELENVERHPAYGSHTAAIRQPFTGEVEVEEEREVEALPRSSYEHGALKTATQRWQMSHHQTDAQIWVMSAPRLLERTTEVIATALWVDDTEPKPIHPWNTLRAHLEFNERPEDKYVEQAKKLIRTAMDRSESAQKDQKALPIGQDLCAHLAKRKG